MVKKKIKRKRRKTNTTPSSSSATSAASAASSNRRRRRKQRGDAQREDDDGDADGEFDEDDDDKQSNDGGGGMDSAGSTPRRRGIVRAEERVKNSDILAYKKLASLPRPSLPGDPPTILGTRVGRFRLDLHDYEEWQGDVGNRVSKMGEEALEQMKKSGTTSKDMTTANRVLDMGRQAFTLTKAVAYDERSKATANKARSELVEAGLMRPVRKKKSLSRPGSEGGEIRVVAAPGHMDAEDPELLSDVEIGMPSSEDEDADLFMMDGIDTRALYHGGMHPDAEGGDGELDSDEDWDTSEWGKEDVEQACVALLDEIEQAEVSFYFLFFFFVFVFVSNYISMATSNKLENL